MIIMLCNVSADCRLPPGRVAQPWEASHQVRRGVNLLQTRGGQPWKGHQRNLQGSPGMATSFSFGLPSFARNGVVDHKTETRLLRAKHKRRLSYLLKSLNSQWKQLLVSDHILGSPVWENRTVCHNLAPRQQILGDPGRDGGQCRRILPETQHTLQVWIANISVDPLTTRLPDQTCQELKLE